MSRRHLCKSLQHPHRTPQQIHDPNIDDDPICVAISKLLACLNPLPAGKFLQVGPIRDHVKVTLPQKSPPNACIANNHAFESARLHTANSVSISCSPPG